MRSIIGRHGTATTSRDSMSTKAAAALLATSALLATPVASQQPTPSPGVPATPAAVAGRGPGLPPRLAEVFLPSRQWRLELTGDGFPAAGLRQRNADDFGATFDRRAGRLAARISAPAIVRGAGRTVVLQDLFVERIGLEYRSLEPDAPPSADAVAALPTRLHALQYSVSWSERLDPRWRLAVSGQAALLGDFENVDLGHLRVTGQVLATRQARPNLQWGAGIGWINLGPRLVPLARLLWADGRGERLDVLLPSRAEYWNEIAGGVEVGGTLRLTGNRYTLGRDDAAPFTTLEFTEGTVGPAVAWRHRQVRVQADGGLAFLRTFRQRGPLEASRSLGPEPGAYARVAVRVAWR